ncbi:MAG: hypothetical protein AAGH79_12630 [Bacteroidota bacterium]
MKNTANMLLLLALISLVTYSFTKWKGETGDAKSDLEGIVEAPEMTDQEMIELSYALEDMAQHIITQINDLQLLSEQSDKHLQRAYTKQIKVLQTLEQKVQHARGLNNADLGQQMVSLHEEVYNQLGKVERRTEYLVSR